jgi:steroid delta-isomerase-like uncharacterized protein
MYQSAEGNKILARQYFNIIWNGNNPDAAERLINLDAVAFVSGDRLQGGLEALKKRVLNLHAAYADPSFEIDDIFASGDKVAVRWTFQGTHCSASLGVPPTNRTVQVTGINIFRFRNGKISELWVNADDLSEMRQIGAIL